jgi:putative transposase
MSEIPFREPGRRTPAKGVHVSSDGANWVFLTVCTEKRECWLAQDSVQSALHDIWQNTATAWLVSDYLLMPDHLHLFCAPQDLNFTIERWIGFWKDRLAKQLKSQESLAPGGPAAPPCQNLAALPHRIGKFQPGGFHHRLREGENYSQKWQYVRKNPVRAGLVEHPEDWPYHGRVHDLRWSGD